MTIVLHTKGPTAWRHAVALYRRGWPGALLRLLASDDPVPAETRAFLAQMAKKHAPKPRGQPATIAKFIEAMRMSSHYQRALIQAQLERKVSGGKRGDPSPSEVALERTAKKFKVSTKTVERALKAPPLL